MTIWAFEKSEFYFLCGKVKLLKATSPWQTSSCNAFNVMGLRRGSCKLPKGNFLSFLRGAKFYIRLEFLHEKLHQKTIIFFCEGLPCISGISVDIKQRLNVQYYVFFKCSFRHRCPFLSFKHTARSARVYIYVLSRCFQTKVAKVHKSC